jgi:hypothetical protein
LQRTSNTATDAARVQDRDRRHLSQLAFGGVVDDEIRRLLSQHSTKASLSKYNLNRVELRSDHSTTAGTQEFIPDLILSKYESVLNTFVYANSFIGKDYFLLRHAGAQLIQYLEVAESEKDLSAQHLETCSFEIENLFYQFISHVYGIKEKLECFLSWDANSNSLSETILNDNAIVKIHGLVRKFFPKIQDCCRARNACIHNTYALTYLKDQSVIRISCFAFTLSKRHFRDQEKSRRQFNLSFPATETTILDVVSATHDLLSGTLKVLSDVRNVDLSRLKDKFVRIENGRSIFEITF